MKTTLTFELPEDREELDAALNGSLYKDRIDTLYNEVFRPHLKYDKPLMPESEHRMQEFTEEQAKILIQVWENVYKHFEDILDN